MALSIDRELLHGPARRMGRAVLAGAGLGALLGLIDAAIIAAGVVAWLGWVPPHADYAQAWAWRSRCFVWAATLAVGLAVPAGAVLGALAVGWRRHRLLGLEAVALAGVVVCGIAATASLWPLRVDDATFTALVLGGFAPTAALVALLERWTRR